MSRLNIQLEWAWVFGSSSKDVVIDQLKRAHEGSSHIIPRNDSSSWKIFMSTDMCVEEDWDPAEYSAARRLFEKLFHKEGRRLTAFEKLASKVLEGHKQGQTWQHVKELIDKSLSEWVKDGTFTFKEDSAPDVRTNS